MRIFSSHQHLYLGLEDEYGKVINEQILITASSGGGKTLASEGIMEEFHKKGYLILVLADPKNEIELGFQMFKPKERYHLNHLRKIGKNPEAKKVKLYHPYTTNLPREKLPDINFYTFSLKEFGRTEWGLIAETEYDKEIVRLMVQSSEEISKEDGIYGFLHHVQDSIKGKESGNIKKADWKNFGLESSSGTMKSITEISSYFRQFKKDTFLTKDSCPLNLDWKKIFSDREHYHVFFSKWIKDEKSRDLIILSLLEGILRNKDYLKCPVLVVLPEIRKICPFKPEGHKIYLSNSIKNALSLMRSSGRGMSSILDSQVYEDISQDIRNSATKTLFGQIGGGSDLDKICKFYGYKREIKEKLKNMPYRNCFILVGKEDEDVFTIFMSSAGHCEPDYNFVEMYKRKGLIMKDYKKIHEMMKKDFKEEENKFKEKIKKREQAEKERKEKEKAEKEAKKQENQEVKKKVKRVKEKEKITDLMKGKLIHELRKNEPTLSLRKQCEKLGIPIGSKGKLNSWEKDYLDSLDAIIPRLSSQKLEEENGYYEE